MTISSIVIAPIFVFLFAVFLIWSYFDIRNANRSFKRREQLLEMIYEKICSLVEDNQWPTYHSFFQSFL